MIEGSCQYGSQLARITLSDGVLMVRFTGASTLRTLTLASAYADDMVAPELVEVQIYDMRCTSLVVTQPEVCEGAVHASHRAASRVRPGAYLISMVHEPLCLRLCWEMAQHGHERAVFTDYETAWKWVKRVQARERLRAALLASQALLLALDPVAPGDISATPSSVRFCL